MRAREAETARRDDYFEALHKMRAEIIATAQATGSRTMAHTCILCADAVKHGM